MVHLCVYQADRGHDDRLSMVCFNNGLTECLVSEENMEDILQNELPDQLMDIFTYNSLDEYMEEFTKLI